MSRFQSDAQKTIRFTASDAGSAGISGAIVHITQKIEQLTQKVEHKEQEYCIECPRGITDGRDGSRDERRNKNCLNLDILPDATLAALSIPARAIEFREFELRRLQLLSHTVFQSIRTSSNCHNMLTAEA